MRTEVRGWLRTRGPSLGESPGTYTRLGACCSVATMHLRLALASALTCSLALPGVAFGHAGLRVPTPRVTDIRAGTSIKTGPCGPYAPGTGTRTTLTAGATFTVEFDETINHTGYFQLFYSEVRDDNFVLIQDRIPHSNAAPSPSFANPRPYSTTITVPNVSCSECTLQLIQEIGRAHV